jgi:uncharacterized protein with von Willebrand factor type A (vWA) domain
MSKSDDTPEKTARLREIFLDVADDDTVTEHQQDSHGTLSPQTADETIVAIVREMCDEYEIRTSLEEDELTELVRLFHERHSDTAIARALGDENRDRTVARARINLHLFRESDFDAPFDIERLQELVDEGTSTAAIATALDVSKSTVRSYSRVLETKHEAAAVEHTYQARFQEALADSGTARPESVRDTLFDGLDDAIDGTQLGG